MIRKVVSQNSKPRYVCEVDQSSFKSKEELTQKDFKLKKPVVNIKQDEICYDSDLEDKEIVIANIHNELHILTRHCDVRGYTDFYNFSSLFRVGRNYLDNFSSDVDGMMWNLLSNGHSIYVLDSPLDFLQFVVMQFLFRRVDLE